MQYEPRVGVILVNHNGSRFLDGCVSALESEAYPPLEIVVVDNASTDDSILRVSEKHAAVTVLRQSVNLGFAEGTNVGVRHLLERGVDYVLLLNNDTTVNRGFLSALVSSADCRTIVAPKCLDWERGEIVNSHVGELDWVRGRLRERFFGQRDGAESSCPQTVSLADGACLLVPAEAFRIVGLLDQSFFLYYEDWDFVVRAKEFGYRILFQPNATLRHYERGTTGPTDLSPVSAYYTTRNRLMFMRKHSNSSWSYRTFLVYFTVTRSIAIARHLLRRKWHLARWTVRGITDFLRRRTGGIVIDQPRSRNRGVTGTFPSTGN